MKALAVESLPELLAVLLTAAGSGVLAVAGALVELTAVGELTTGHVTIGIWELCFGALLLYAGVYLLGYRRLLPAVRSSSDAGA